MIQYRKNQHICIFWIILFPFCVLSGCKEKDINYFEPQQGDFDWLYDEKEVAIVSTNEKDMIDFELYKSKYDRGIYEYYVWVDIDTGMVYLKAFKIKKIIWDEPLSVEGLKRDSPMEIDNRSNNFVKCGPRRFVILEDFWVENYLAKFELWYKPQNDEKEKLLISKIYKIEGFID
ncbi:hypothetical protein FACS18945_4310 [Bacteroidia bacterium]|nr:hypothetical protein FACS18945_4310 [Bacteroidia bacterium]